MEPWQSKQEEEETKGLNPWFIVGGILLLIILISGSYLFYRSRKVSFLETKEVQVSTVSPTSYNLSLFVTFNKSGTRIINRRSISWSDCDLFIYKGDTRYTAHYPVISSQDQIAIPYSAYSHLDQNLSLSISERPTDFAILCNSVRGKDGWNMVRK